ncbi:MAG: alpha/beta hydrolase-fold protein [Verrucomicrobiales bacterium]
MNTRFRFLLPTLAFLASTALQGIAEPGQGLESASTLTRPTSAARSPDPDGFIQRWTILEPIPSSGLTDSAVRTAIEKDYFPDQLTVLPKDGDKVTVDDAELVWHSVDTQLYNVNLYHFAYALGKPTSNVLFWGVTIVNCPEELTNVRLAIGSNAASVWWVNGEEVASVYGDRQTVIDDGVSKRLTLKKGTNILRCAVINGGGATDFCARFLDAEERPLQGYTVSVAESAPTRPPRARQRFVAKPPLHPIPILPALPEPDDTSFYSEKDVPHGKVEVVHYKTAAGIEKRMHMYLPPGYDANEDQRYPVLYLNHGGGENDSHWTVSGFTHNILDNLIADGKARAMIVAMPNTGGVVSGKPPKPGEDDACTQEYLSDILPFVDSHYRTLTNRESRAVAGLSMGGFVTLNTGLTHLETFGELYVFSSGYWPDMLPAFRENIQALLSDPEINEKFAMPIYFGVGETDIAYLNSMKTLAVFNEHGIRNFSVLSSHGHEWLNWRRYLYQTAQIMFPDHH